MPFILIVIGVILVVLNYKALKKDESSFSDVLKYKQKDMTEVEVEIGAIRRDIAESLTELQKEVLEIKQHINFNNNVEDIKENLASVIELLYLYVNIRLVPKIRPIPIPIRIFLSHRKLNTSFIFCINSLLIILPPYLKKVFHKSHHH